MDGKSLVSDLLRTLRREQGLSQRALAGRAEVPQPTIAEIEAGRREPTISLLSRIAESVGLSLEVRLVPLDPSSAVATGRTIADRLAGPAPVRLREDGALRALIDFRDTLGRSSLEECARLVASPPGTTGDRRWDALLAAVVEDECARNGCSSPRWTNETKRFIKPFWYLSEVPALHDWEAANSPAAFVRHGVLAAEEELESV